MSKKYVLPKQTFWDYVRDPLGSLSFYFDVYEGKNFKYAENIIQATDLLQDWKYKIDEFFSSLFGFLFDMIGKMINFSKIAFKTTIILLITATSLFIIWKISSNFEQLKNFLEIPRFLGYFISLVAFWFISATISRIQCLIWLGYRSRYTTSEFMRYNFALIAATGITTLIYPFLKFI